MKGLMGREKSKKVVQIMLFQMLSVTSTLRHIVKTNSLFNIQSENNILDKVNGNRLELCY